MGLSNGKNIFDLRSNPPKKKIEEHFYSSLKLIYTFITHTKTVGEPLLAALAAAMCSLLLPNCEVLHSMRLLSLLANYNEVYARFAFT